MSKEEFKEAHDREREENEGSISQTEGIDEFDTIDPEVKQTVEPIIKPIKISMVNKVKRAKIIKDKKPPKPRKISIDKFIKLQNKENIKLRIEKVRTPSEQKKYDRLKRYNKAHKEKNKVYRRKYYLEHKGELRKKSIDKWNQYREDRDKYVINKILIQTSLKEP